MSEKNIKKIGIKQDTGEYAYVDIGVDANNVDIDETTNLIDKLAEIDTKANKSIYGDDAISLGRKANSTVGKKSIALGYNTTASGDYSHAQGYNTTASGDQSHAEGYITKASGENCHAEGLGTTASGYSSHAEGSDTTASGEFSHAEGKDTTASGDYSHAEGANTTASGEFQHVQGKFNVEDIGDKYAHIVGGGDDEDHRRNIHTLDWNGNAEFAGEVKCSNVLKTVSECVASTKDTDIAGASALAEFIESSKPQMVTGLSISLASAPTMKSVLDTIGFDLSNVNAFSIMEFVVTASSLTKYENENLVVAASGVTVISEPFTILAINSQPPRAIIRMPIAYTAQWATGYILRKDGSSAFSDLKITGAKLII